MKKLKISKKEYFNALYQLLIKTKQKELEALGVEKIDVIRVAPSGDMVEITFKDQEDS